MSEQTVHLIITRQDGPNEQPYTEEFKLPYRKNMNVISALMEIQRNPVNAKGEKTTPVVGSPTVWKRCAAPVRW